MKAIRLWTVLLMCLVLASQLAESVSLFALVQQGSESKEMDEKETGNDDQAVQTKCLEAPARQARQARHLHQLNVLDDKFMHFPPLFRSQIAFLTPMSQAVVLRC